MTFDIHYEYADGTPDVIRISGDSVDEIRATAKAELEARCIDEDTVWSDEADNQIRRHASDNPKA